MMPPGTLRKTASESLFDGDDESEDDDAEDIMMEDPHSMPETKVLWPRESRARFHRERIGYPLLTQNDLRYPLRSVWQLLQIPPVSSSASLSERTHLVAWMNRSPEKNPIYRFMGISKGVNGLGGSKFIHPMSSFNMYMQVCLGSLTRPGSVLAQTVHIVAAGV